MVESLSAEQLYEWTISSKCDDELTDLMIDFSLGCMLCSIGFKLYILHVKDFVVALI
jgi:hypothetical protein